MRYEYNMIKSEGTKQSDESEHLEYLDVKIDGTTRLELSNGDYRFNFDKGDVAFEIDKETAVSLAKGILLAYNEL